MYSAVLALLIAVSPAALAEETLYSMTFYGDGSGKYVSDTCKLVPHDCNVSLNGEDALPILVNPWEPVSINIRCVELVFLPSLAVARNAFLFVGNSYSPDVMLWATADSGGHARNCFPAGSSFPFPAAAAGAAANRLGQNDFALPHLDVHLRGTVFPSLLFWKVLSYLRPFAFYEVYLTVYYTKNPV